MAVPATVVYFTTYEQVKAFLGYHHDGPSRENWYKPILAGSGARGKKLYLELNISALLFQLTKGDFTQLLVFRRIRWQVSGYLCDK